MMFAFDNGQRGFTLLEVLVALTVVAIALASMLRVEARLTADGAEVESRVLAHFVARNRIAALRVSRNWPGDTGLLSGTEEEAGRTFYWQVQPFPTADPGVVRLEVSVSEDASGEALARMSSFQERVR